MGGGWFAAAHPSAVIAQRTNAAHGSEQTCAITTLYKLGDRMKLFVHNHCVLAYSSVLKLSVNTSILSFIHSSIIQNNRYTRIKQSFYFLRTCYLRFLFLMQFEAQNCSYNVLFFPITSLYWNVFCYITLIANWSHNAF